MADQKLLEDAGKYIEKYYETAKDDIKDEEMLNLFDKIPRLRKWLAKDAGNRQPDAAEEQNADKSILGKQENGHR